MIRDKELLIKYFEYQYQLVNNHSDVGHRETAMQNRGKAIAYEHIVDILTNDELRKEELNRLKENSNVE